MTFDEAIDEVKSHDNTYDETSGIMNTFSVLDIIDELRKKYAPTVEMTKEQRKGLLFDGKGRETPHKNFVFMKEVQKVNEKNINIDILMSAFVHPETIKIIDEDIANDSKRTNS